MLTAGIVFAILFSIIVFGLPIVIALGGIGAVWIIVSGNNPMAIVSSYYSGINSFVQLAVPFFILAGDIMSRSKITDKLIDFSRIFVGRIRSGLAYTNILASMFFAGLTGAGISDVATISPVFVPAMEKEGYTRAWAAMITAVSSIIGPTIPPSIIAVIYGATTNTSIGGLLLACIIPGCLIGFSQMAAVRLVRKKYNLPDDRQFIPKKEIPGVLKGATLALIMPLIILGGIMSGLFTPTEAAVIAVVYAFIVGLFIYRTISYTDIIESLKITVKSSATMYMLMASGAILTWIMARTGVPGKVASTLISISDTPAFIFLISMLIVFFLGLFMDNAVALILVAPILVPIARQVGIPDFQFGASMIVALNIGLITPPFGMCLFASAAVNNVKVEEILKVSGPFLIASVVGLLLTILIPEVSLFLPRLGGFM